MRRTGFVWNEKFAWFELQAYGGVVRGGVDSMQPDRHVYDPEVVRRFRNLVDVSGLLKKLVDIPARLATGLEIGRVHTSDHINQIKIMSGFPTGGEPGDDAPVPYGAFEIASLAAGGAIAAVDAVMSGEVDNAYALLRPAGHHSRPDRSMGFCIFSNAAIAGRHLLDFHNVKRIAYVDWDVHHGNGTQAALYKEPRALTISIHQDRLYPVDDGFVEQIGEGRAEGTNLNIPLPPGCGVEAYCAAYDRVVIPALQAFRPDIIIVPSGFDAGAMDPMGRMMMHSDGYRQLTRKLMAAADELCGGRLVFLHEGGYSRWTVPYFGLAVLEELSGISTGTSDPHLEYHKALGGQELLPHQTEAIDAAAANVARVPQPACQAGVAD
ncbi:class II histone deacetylase [Phenylobacterium sp. Root700]|uniref:class II histone deacetylase n=1 Tax=Phenylobacterium sp. Root700 TaxID=1736591 RepID=UPI0006F24FC3|nr:class II histone deacetylase [Phenylobacterium sp. Root700]KRB49655.1 acetoin utilization protein [Phenylobacterium sp. Root700]